ncbi:hypothetical protein ACYOEI_29700, partial [Singulisphaera rosea]
MAVDRTLVQIRERTVLDLLDLSLVVVRERPVALGLAAFVGIAPFAAFDAWLLNTADLPIVIMIVLLLLQTPWATAPLTVVLGGLMFGERPSVRRVAGTLIRSFFPIFIYQTVIRTILIVTCVGYLLFVSRYTFLNEVILLERGRVRGSLKRVVQLSDSYGGELFAQWLAQIFFGTLFVLGFGLGTSTILGILFKSQMTWEPAWSDIVHPLIQFGLWLAIAFFGVVRFMAYIDRRIRLEGWEVELRLRAA